MHSFLQEAEALQEKLVETRHFLHQHPGTGFDIEDTVAFVKKELTAMGYEPKECGKAGLVATVGNPDKGKVFLLRADMDALPMAEEAQVEFPSQNGKMHACGHDLHTTMLLGAAKLLKEHENELNGVVKLMFQPAEEIFEGSADMLQNGVLKEPEVDKALMIHVMANMPFAPGTVIVCAPGVSAPAADYFQIEIQGKGCHGSMPNTGVDPITIAARVITGLQEISAREMALSEEAVLTFGFVQAGNAENVIPDTVRLGGTLRTYDEKVRCFIKKRMEEIAGGIASAFRGEAKVVFGSGCPTLVNDSELAESVPGYLQELLGNASVFTAAQLSAMEGDSGASKSAGSEDFAYISQQVPSIMLALAAGQPEKGYSYPQHHPKVKFDESVLSKGAAVYAWTAMCWLEEN